MNRPALNQFRIRDFSSSVGSALTASTQAQDSNQAKSFRLLCLDDLTLRQFDIGSSPPYIAISHAWSERLFDDIPGFDSSLGGRAIRKAFSEKFPATNHYWVDNFCILQDNENDKFEQIPLMGEIYRGADAVLIIHACELGLTQDELDEALSGFDAAFELRKIGTYRRDEKWRYWRKGDGYTKIVRAMKALAKFAQSDWSSRVWTLQEFIFARTIVWIGSELIPLTCEEYFFCSIPGLCVYLNLGIASAPPGSEFDRLVKEFLGMANMRAPGFEPTRIMEITSIRKASLRVDEIYGAMALSGVQITPLQNETIEQAWLRWCEAAVARGHIRWLMLPPIGSSVLYSTQGNCLFPCARMRGSASACAIVGTVVPYGPPSISAGTVTLAAKYAGNCTILRRLGSLHQYGGKFYAIISLALFSKGDWSLAVHIAESFSSGVFSRKQLNAIAKVLVNNYEPALGFIRENENKPEPGQFTLLISAQWEREASSAFENLLNSTVIPMFTGAVAYLALLESEELQLSLPVALALDDRVPTGPLVAFDVNARISRGTILLIAEIGSEDLQRELYDPDFGPEDFFYHKVGITLPVQERFGTPLESINIGGPRCPVCQTIDEVA
ncbi:hypothetical protein NA56DRAFT_580067 [Hyaloscypha hepaticicola]|uniref:Heterokaryon incompatibility domain-containing protein n=1 Tax=Hyaloscypha hepaticicola TaxID=2082293 RepID=A0A2J6PRR4_9HELO|nr:hypothetical protein NA56DRAFT_580067 [Hyaloscypha hepaticicola]